MSRTVISGKAISRRALSMILAGAVLVTVMAGVISGMIGNPNTEVVAQNPSTLAGLNHNVVVQQINLLPVDPDVDSARTDLDISSQSASRNTYGNYVDVSVNDDDSVDISITQDSNVNVTTTNKTSFVEVFTQVNQKINLAENPWLMLRWSGSGRCNGRIYFSITKDGKEYGSGGKELATDFEDTTSFQDWVTGSNLFTVSLSNVVNNNTAGYEYVNQTETDFNAGTVADYSIDLYKYLKGQTAFASYFPSGEQWKDSSKNYITIYASCQIVASEADQKLTAGTMIHWEKFALGREVMDRPASMLPRNAEIMNITASDGTTGVDYGRASKLDDGSVTFLNTSETENVMFTWNLRNYFNATELESLFVSATYSGMTSAQFDLRTWYGGRTTTYVEPSGYNYRGTNQSLQYLVTNYARSSNITSSTTVGGTFEAVVDFHSYLMWADDALYNETGSTYTGEYQHFFPDDSLIYIGDVKLTLPAGAKITFTQLEFQVENEQIPATQANTVYPWASDESPNGLPPEGTPALSTALNGSSGTSYDWAATAEDAPIVKTKIDLLAMKTYSFNEWDEDAINTSKDEEVGVPYTRKSDGSSIYSSQKQTNNSYYSLMRYGPSDDWSRNYYTYIQTSETPYLYYSYELTDTTPEDDIAPSGGFYFHFQNARRDTYTQSNNVQAYSAKYYLDHSGIALNECDSFYTLDYYYGTKAILSSSTKRTGCINISSLFDASKITTTGLTTTQIYNMTTYLMLEELRVYLGAGTDIQIHYLFIGSESLDESAIGTFATQGGEAYPWATTKASFDAQTDPDSATSKITFANKVDVLEDLQDRVAFNGGSGIPGGTVDSDTGAVTVTVTNPTNPNVNTDYYQQAGTSFDHQWRLLVADAGDLAAIRYLNYSVDAPAGMRWSIMISEQNTSTTQQRALLTWCDADARWNDDNIYTAAPAGKSYFRYAATGSYTDVPEFDTYWYQKNNTSWRIYSVPGSQTGCIDLQQAMATFEWDSIISIYLIAYQDPNLVLEEGESPSVTFNYVYLTSEPIEKADVGQAATSAGTIYNWGNTSVSAPTAATKRTFSLKTAAEWSDITAINYELDSNSVDLTATPYLYYSYRFYDTKTGKTVDADGVPLRVSMWIVENNTYHYRRNTAGADSNRCENIGVPSTLGTNTGYGRPSFVRLNDSTTTSGQGYKSIHYFGYASETGCINLAEYFVNDVTILNRIRFCIDSKYYADQDGDDYNDADNRYQLIVDYLFLGTAATSSTSLTKEWMPPMPSAPTPADFQQHLLANGTAVSAGTQTLANVIEIDLSKTPYLFYCMEYAAGQTGTFGLTTDVAVNESYVFYRDAGRTDGILISAGDAPPSSGRYMLQSETGCIDVRAWYRANGYQDDILRISAVNFWGASGTMKYLYFGAEADKTIDLIPETASGELDNGLPTAAWVVMTLGSDGKPGQCGEIIASNGEWDVYDEATIGSSVPTAKLKFTGDTTNDGYNDLRLYNDRWSQAAICYGNIVNKGAMDTFSYVSTGNCQMSGLTIDLNETPYLHFSIQQSDDSQVSMVLQTNNYTASADLNGKPANEVKPWLSAYCPTSPAGQLITIVSEPKVASYYKDHVMYSEGPTSVTGNVSGVIDLRSWYTVTNGYDNVISLERIRFYTYDNDGTATDLNVNHLYLSSSASAAYAVTFNKNDGSDTAYTQYVLKNANEQYISDDAVEHFKQRDGYTFVGWYTDSTCETYFDITGTPMTGNVHLYARWIKNDNIASGKEVNLLSSMDYENRKILSGSGTVELDEEALSVVNTASDDFKVTFPVGTAYSVEALRSLFMGFDTSKTCEGLDILVDVKCSSSREYSIVQEAFAADFLTSTGALTAAPYDREAALYTYLGVRDDLPVRENVDGLIEINSVTLVVPAGVSLEIRYIKAANEMALMGNTDSRAPAAVQSIDLLDNADDDPAFVNKTGNVVFTTLASKSVTYLNKEYTQAALHGIDSGCVHLGGLYNHTIDMKQIKEDLATIAAASAEEKATTAYKTWLEQCQENRYLYFSIDQPEDSYVTFALYASFSGMVESNTSGTRDKEVNDVYTKKSVSYYSAAAGGLVAKDYSESTEGFVPVETAFINGNLVGKIDLYTWYQDALAPYRSNSEVTAVELLGVRLYTSDRSTDATFNYLFIGNDETALSKGNFNIFAEYPYLSGKSGEGIDADYVADHRHVLGTAKRGETFYVTLDQLDNLKDDIVIDDPSKQFVGWVFRDIAYWSLPSAERDTVGLSDEKLLPYLIYWNPNATNGNKYDPTTNPGGSWSLTAYEGFSTNVKSVFYTFSTDNGNTQVIIPIFASVEYQPTVTANVTGDGTVSMITAEAVHSSAEHQWQVPFASEVLLHAEGDGFIGWYDRDGVLISTAADCVLTVTSDIELTAVFEPTATEVSNTPVYLPQGGRTIVWLQSAYGKAGTDFYLQSVNNGDIEGASVSYSNITDTTGTDQIACYWNMADSQLLTAVAPDGYHWEQLFSDGTSLRVSAKNEYTFVASTNIKLICVEGADASDFETTVMIDEYAYDDDRDDQMLRFNGQVICADNERVLSCGLVFTDYKNHGEIPSIGCAASETVAATAWNSTTGQFVVEFSIATAPEYCVRGYAIVYNTKTDALSLRYSECVATVF